MIRKLLKKIPQSLYVLIWFIPFIFFAFGYFLSFINFQKKTRIVPNLIGKNLQEALLTTSAKQLALRLLQEKEDSLLPEGTIIQQSPKPYQTARLNQSIFVTISKKPKCFCAPNTLGKKIPEITAELIKHGISTNIVTFKDKHSQGTCVAQAPQYGKEISNKKMLIYSSKGMDTLHIMPNLKQQSLKDGYKLAKQPHITVESFDTNGFPIHSEMSDYTIIDQKPMAGSIINLKKPLNVQFLAELE